MIPLLSTLLTLLATALAEWLHARRIRAVGRLAFGPAGAARGWTRAVPGSRVLALTAFAWGLATLWMLKIAADDAVAGKGKPAEEATRLVFVADLSPSMYLQDAGPDGKQTRQARMREVVEAILQRVSGNLRFGVIGFYTDSLPVVMEARDPELVRNVFNGLPVAYAMPLGETDLGQAINASLVLVKDFPDASTRLIIFTDGDSVNIAPLASRPKSVRDVMFLGLGNPTKGTFIDGHQSRQEPDTLRRLATELRGTYEDVNEKHLSTAALGDLVVRAPLPQRGLSLAQLAVLAMVGGGCRISRPSPTEPVKVLHAGLLGGAGTEWLAGGGFQQDGTIVLAGPAGEGIATLGGDVQELPAPAEDSKRSGCAHTYLARLSPDAAKVIWVRHVKMDIRGECENGRARLQRMGRGRAQPRLRGADIEFRDPTGAKWPNFFYGKPAGDAGVISLNPAKPAASFALLCDTMAQDRGDQSRRVLGELCPPEKPPAVTLTITSICALQSAAAGAKGKPGATADLTGTIEIAGRKLPVKAAATFRNHDGKGDEKNAALLLDGKFALKAADLGLKTVPAASVIEVRFALTAYPASSSTAPPPARK